VRHDTPEAQVPACRAAEASAAEVLPELEDLERITNEGSGTPLALVGLTMLLAAGEALHALPPAAWVLGGIGALGMLLGLFGVGLDGIVIFDEDMRREILEEGLVPVRSTADDWVMLGLLLVSGGGLLVGLGVSHLGMASLRLPLLLVACGVVLTGAGIRGRVIWIPAADQLKA
jgi:hypothetical protein